MSSSTAIEPTAQNGNVPATAEQPRTIKGWLNSEGFKNEIARALPKHCSPERMTRIAITAMTRTPLLSECEPASFMRALLDLSQWGLEPNGRDAHLIPFRNNKRGVVECQLILDYKGLVQLLYRSGQVMSVHADVVYEGDDFDYSMGEVTRHTPWWIRKDRDKPTSQGKLIAAYARVALKGNAVKCEVMSLDQIEAIRKRSKAANSGPWQTDYNEMAKKTVFRRTTKWLPVSAEIIQAFERDDDRPAHFGASTVIDSDFVVPPTSLNQLADRRKEQAEGEAGETVESDGEIVDTDQPADLLTALKDKIALAMTVADVESIRAANVGPESSLPADQWDIVDSWCNARLEVLQPKTKPKGDGTMFDKGQQQPE